MEPNKPTKRRKMKWMTIVFRMETILMDEVKKRKFYPELVHDAIRNVEKSGRYLPSALEVKTFCEVMDLQSLAGRWW